MALDKNGVPIPVYTPPRPRPPDATPPPHPNPQLENDVSLLKNDVSQLKARVENPAPVVLVENAISTLKQEAEALRSRVDTLTLDVSMVQARNELAAVQAQVDAADLRMEAHILAVRAWMDNAHARLDREERRRLEHPVSTP